MCLFIQTSTHSTNHQSIHPLTLPNIHSSIQTSIHLFSSIQPSIHSSTQTFISPSKKLIIHLSIHPFIHPFVHLFKLIITHLSNCQSVQTTTSSTIHQSIHPFTRHPNIHPSKHPSILPNIHPSQYSSIYPNIHLSIQASNHPPVHPSVQANVYWLLTLARHGSSHGVYSRRQVGLDPYSFGTYLLWGNTHSKQGSKYLEGTKPELSGGYKDCKMGW